MPPWYFSSTILNMVPILLALSVGGAFEVSLVFIAVQSGTTVGTLFWSRYVARSGRYTLAFLLGYLGLFLACLGLYMSQKLEVIIITAFLGNFVSYSTYFGAIYLVKREFDKVEEGLSKLENLGGWGSIGAMLFASLTSSALGNNLLSLLVAMISLGSTFLSALLLGQRIPRERIEGLGYKMGLLPLLERGLDFITVQGERVADLTGRSIGFVAKGGIFVEPWVQNVGFPKTHRYLHLASFMAFLGMGLAFSQIFTLFKSQGVSDSLIFGFSLVSGIVSTATFRRMGKRRASVNTLFVAFLARVGAIIALVATLFVNPDTATILYFPLHAFLGLTGAYIMMSLNSLFLRVGQEAFGINSFIRNLGSIMGSSASGVLIISAGMPSTFFVASLMLLGAAALLRKERGTF